MSLYFILALLHAYFCVKYVFVGVFFNGGAFLMFCGLKNKEGVEFLRILSGWSDRVDD